MKELKKGSIFASAIGGMAEWSNAAVLKTVEGHTSGGSNPSSSAKTRNESCGFFLSTYIIRIEQYHLFTGAFLIVLRG